MLYNEIFRNVKGYFREEDLFPIDLNELDYKKLGYSDLNDFKETLKPFKTENIYKTTSPVYLYIYADYEKQIYTEMFDLSKNIIQQFVLPEKRESYITKTISEKNYLNLYISMFSNMLALDFIKNYKKIPLDQIKDVFLYIYQSMDYNFDIFPREVIEDVFKIIKSNSFKSDKLIKIYRGMETESTPLEKAWSWTTKKSVAKKFATRWKTGLGTIYEGYIKEKDIIHMEDNGEYEVLCFYEDIIDIKEAIGNEYSEEFILFKKEYDKEYSKYSCYIDQELFNTGVHDYHHSLRVLYWTLVLSDKLDLPDKDKKILIQAALLHDIGRVHDYVDINHGRRAVEKIEFEELNPLELSNKDLDIVNKIIYNHCIDDNKIKEDNDYVLKLIRVFKDCDALDRVRIADLDPNYLRFEESKNLINYAEELIDYI